MKQLKTTGSLALVAALCSVLASACSNDDDDDSGGSGADTGSGGSGQGGMGGTGGSSGTTDTGGASGGSGGSTASSTSGGTGGSTASSTSGGTGGDAGSGSGGDDEPARIRVLHLSPDAPGVDVFVNGGDEAAVEALEFPDGTPYLEVPAGTYTFDVSPAGTSSFFPSARRRRRVRNASA